MNKNIPAFEDLWNEIILHSINLCFNQLDIAFKEQAQVTKCNLEEYKNNLENIYKRKREWLKLEYLPNENNPTLDFHKLASVLCRSMVGLKFFTFDIDTAEKLFCKISKSKKMSQSEKVAWQVDNVYVNYKLAFLVAEGVAYVDLLYWAQEKINNINFNYTDKDISTNIANVRIKLKIYEKFIYMLSTKKNRLYGYEKSEIHDNFYTSSVIALMKNDFLKRDFDYLQFAISVFQWQEYTKKQHLYDIINSNEYKLSISELV